MRVYYIDSTQGRKGSGPKSNLLSKRLTVSSLIGNAIFSPGGDNLGRIKDVMIDIAESKIKYVVIGFGGFFGISEKYIAVPMQALKIDSDRKNTFILNENKEFLKRYAGFHRDHSSKAAVALTPVSSQADLSDHKVNLRLLFPNLNDKDFHYDYGKKDTMICLLEKKLGKSREELTLLLLGL